MRNWILGIAAIVILASCGVAAAETLPANDAAPHKVFVCKYVGTPGVDERLQTGDNPISVDISALKNFVSIGSFFNDAQGRSVAIAFDTGQPEPSVSQCPGYEPPPPPPTTTTSTTLPNNTTTTSTTMPNVTTTSSTTTTCPDCTPNTQAVTTTTQPGTTTTLPPGVPNTFAVPGGTTTTTVGATTTTAPPGATSIPPITGPATVPTTQPPVRVTTPPPPPPTGTLPHTL